MQSQTLTVDRQLKRYRVPRLAFVNKCDRTGANPLKVVEQLRERLGQNAVLLQLPIGLEGDFRGFVDLVTMKAYTYAGPMNQDIVEEPIPRELQAQAEALREELLEAASMFSDELAAAYLEGHPTEEQIHEAVRKGCLALKLTPVFVGAAARNVGVQALLDGVVRYLPDPSEVENRALDLENGEAEVALKAGPRASDRGAGVQAGGRPVTGSCPTSACTRAP